MRLRASVASAWTVPVAVSLVSAGVYLPVLRAGFVDWDDTTLLVRNSAYRGFGAAQLRWMLTSDLLGHYAPVTWLSFALDYMIWGVKPFGFHLTNLILHAINAGLVALVARRLLAKALVLSAPSLMIGAGTAALLFALHPLRVETVAWITERRGLLSACLFLLSALAYLDATQTQGRARHARLAGSVAAFILALAAKASVLTLPVVLLLLDVYPLSRLPLSPRRWLDRDLRHVWLEKVPYALCAAASAVGVQFGLTGVTDAVRLPVLQWLAKVAQGLWFYTYRTAVPLGLSPLYELPPELSLTAPPALVGAVGVAALSAVAWASRRACPGLLAAWLYQLIMLAPFMGILHAGYQLFADRYSYLPSLGWALLGGALAAAIARAWESGRIGPRLAGLGAAVGVAVLLSLAALTTRQIAVWRDPGTLWEYAIGLGADCSICHAQLGSYYLERGAPQAALAQFGRTVALRPDRVRVRIPMAEALVRVGRLDDAVVELRRVLERYPELLPSRLLLAATLVRLGRPEEAAAELRGATKAASASEVATYLERARAREPDSAVVRAGLVYAYLALDRPDLARAEREALERLTPVAERLVGPRPP
jgi:protein O-mannosyl-transferase